jgi:hypothetical protein
MLALIINLTPVRRFGMMVKILKKAINETNEKMIQDFFR